MLKDPKLSSQPVVESAAAVVNKVKQYFCLQESHLLLHCNNVLEGRGVLSKHRSQVYTLHGDKHTCMLNNYWMRLSMISWIIKTEVCVICLSLRLRQITQTRGFDYSWYHAKTEFNNSFIIHFSHNSSPETEVKHSAILFLRTLQGA